MCPNATSKRIWPHFARKADIKEGKKAGRRASGRKKNHSIKPAYCIFAYYTSREQYQSITSLVGGHFGCLDTSKTQFVTKVLM